MRGPGPQPLVVDPTKLTLHPSEGPRVSVLGGGALNTLPLPSSHHQFIRDTGLIPGSGRSPGGWHGNPLQYSCLENSTDGGAWQATVHGVTKSRTRLSNFTHTHTHTSPGQALCPALSLASVSSRPSRVTAPFSLGSATVPPAPGPASPRRYSPLASGSRDKTGEAEKG